MTTKWKRPTKGEIERIRTECKQKGISEERAEMLIADACRSPEEAERHAKEILAKWEAEDDELPRRNPEELRAWADELYGRRPPRKLPPESAVYLPTWIHDYGKRKPHAPKPWFWIQPEDDGFAVWDGRCFVKGGGWEEIEPHPRRYHDAWELALLYASAVECLNAAVQLSADTGTDCEVHAYPAEAYYPLWEIPSGVMLDLLRLKKWVRLLVKAANSHYNAGLDPQTPLDQWIRRGYLPHGTIYPVNGIYFWYPDSTDQLWDRLKREFSPPTYFEVIARRGDCSRED
jgi:hypothetical protein